MGTLVLRFEQVVEIGARATCTSPADPREHRDDNGSRDWLFEDGHVWSIQREGAQIRSLRLARAREVPQTGWRHRDGCDCRYCTDSG